ncbi:MAG: aldo/keto reductase [Defluviitaleaceae bacterium]|nr:aldo/keto reductase [Defluviitaleaceae bacterium]
MQKQKVELGFGAMRLPSDAAECKKMFARFLESGYDYFDTAYVYGGSEAMIKKGLTSVYPRSKYRLANKLPVWMLHEYSDCNKYFKESLSRCGVDYFDAYLMHSMNAGSEKKARLIGAYEWAAEAKRKGLCKQVGLSFHDSPAVLDDMLESHPEMDFVQLQLNYMDVLRGQGDELLRIANRHKVPIIVMEPLRGGSLAKLPQAAEDILRAADPSSTPAVWGNRYAASLEGVYMVLSGLSTMAQTEENIRTFLNFMPMTEKEYDVLFAALIEMSKVSGIPCTACKYCHAECPKNIDIAACFSLFNEGKRGHATWHRNMMYEGIPEGCRAEDCDECGKCVQRCTQGINIPAELKIVAAEMKNK